MKNPKCPHCSCSGKSIYRVATGKLVFARCVSTHMFWVCPKCYGKVRDLAPDYQNMECVDCGHIVNITSGASFGGNDETEQLKLF